MSPHPLKRPMDLRPQIDNPTISDREPDGVSGVGSRGARLRATQDRPEPPSSPSGLVVVAVEHVFKIDITRLKI